MIETADKYCKITHYELINNKWVDITTNTQWANDRGLRKIVKTDYCNDNNTLILFYSMYSAFNYRYNLEGEYITTYY